MLDRIHSVKGLAALAIPVLSPHHYCLVAIHDYNEIRLAMRQRTLPETPA